MNDKRQCYGVLIGAAGGLLLGVFLAHLWTTGHPEASILLVQTIAAVLTAGILGATLYVVISYTIAAQRSAEAIQDQAEATLASYASLLVVDPIKTVGDYVCEGKLAGVSKDKYGWLVIEMQNVGSRRAWNIKAQRSEEWDSGCCSEWMQRDVKCFEDWEEKHEWRAGCVLPDESWFFYFPPPAKCDNDAHIGFGWYDPLYYPWENQVGVFKKGCRWHTNWDKRPERHWRKEHGG